MDDAVGAVCKQEMNQVKIHSTLDGGQGRPSLSLRPVTGNKTLAISTLSIQGIPSSQYWKKGSESGILALRRRGRGSCKDCNEKGLSAMEDLTGG